MTEQCLAALITLAFLLSLALWVPLLHAVARLLAAARKSRSADGIPRPQFAARFGR